MCGSSAASFMRALSQLAPRTRVKATTSATGGSQLFSVEREVAVRAAAHVEQFARLLSDQR
jgi:hypothetical protein